MINIQIFLYTYHTRIDEIFSSFCTSIYNLEGKCSMISKNVFKTLGMIMFTGASSVAFSSANVSKLSTVWDKTFSKSDKVSYEKVAYSNRYGIKIVADLYTPKNMDKSNKYPAIVVGPPYGGVKEQGAGIYAQTMAERGFVALAFDPSYNGESGGEPRHVSSPDIFVEDFSAAVDFLGLQSYVDREKIGVIGICGSGGFALTATQANQRIKAVATLSMYDISRQKRMGLYDSLSDKDRKNYLEQISKQRWEDAENGTPKLTPQFPNQPLEKIPDGLDPITSEFFEYYTTKRGFHPRSIGAFTISSEMDFINFPLMNYLDTISPRPILFVVGENAHSRYFSEDAYKKAAEPKELYVVKGARHIDLYDRVDLIPFDKLEKFFNENLK